MQMLFLKFIEIKFSPWDLASIPDVSSYHFHHWIAPPPQQTSDAPQHLQRSLNSYPATYGNELHYFTGSDWKYTNGFTIANISMNNLAGQTESEGASSNK